MDSNPYASPLAEESRPSAPPDPLKVSFGESIVQLVAGMLNLIAILLGLLSIVAFVKIVGQQGGWTPWHGDELIVEAMALGTAALGYSAYRLEDRLNRLSKPPVPNPPTAP